MSEIHDCESCAHGAERVTIENYEQIDEGRRGFIKQAMLAGAMLALVACGMNSIPTAPTSVHSSINVNDYPQLANVGGVAVVTVNGTRLAVVRTSASTFLALSLICPHQGGDVVQVSGGFQCTRHGAEFNSTGQWIGGQPTSSLRSYDTTYDAATGSLTIS